MLSDIATMKSGGRTEYFSGRKSERMPENPAKRSKKYWTEI